MSVSVTFDFPRAENLQRGSSQHGIDLISGVIAFDSSYPTNGEDVSDITGKFKTCCQIICECAGGYCFEFDKTNSKIKAYWVDTTTDGAPMAEVTNSTNLSAIDAKFIAIGY